MRTLATIARDLRHIVLALLLLLALPVFGQGYAKELPPGQSSFVLGLANGDILHVRNTSSPAAQQIMRLTAVGDLVWSNTYGAGVGISRVTPIETMSGDILLGVVMILPSDGSTAFGVLRLAADGSAIRVTGFPGRAASSLNILVQHGGDDGYHILYNTGNLNLIEVAHMSEEDEFLSAFTTANVNLPMFGVCELDGYLYGAGPHGRVKTHFDGTPVWWYVLEPGTSSALTRVVRAGDELFMTGMSPSGGLLLVSDTSGTILREQCYDKFFGVASGTYIGAAPDRYHVLWHQGTDLITGWLVVDTDLNVMGHFADDPQYSMAAGTSVAMDGAALVTVTGVTSQQGILLYKSDADGTLGECWSEWPVDTAPMPQLVWQPVAATTQSVFWATVIGTVSVTPVVPSIVPYCLTTIVPEEQGDAGIEVLWMGGAEWAVRDHGKEMHMLELIDAGGRLVRTVSARGNEAHITTAGLASGLHLLRVHNADGGTWSRRIMVAP